MRLLDLSDLPHRPIEAHGSRGFSVAHPRLSSPRMSTCVVTGGAGFVGSHLCDRFLREGHQVVGMDNFITGSAANIAHLLGTEGFHFIRSGLIHAGLRMQLVHIMFNVFFLTLTVMLLFSTAICYMQHQ